ncbi:alanine--glyoxylate aminotransferase family protein [Candidatus Bathyarchaeota archaeon]|nr:alanine--glyoxylate aminotransferase family protein [Candidatus Bathyarchaeota archaeon]MBS7617713.1 alanine--glyoxylate aminotransferase family protein [Candidatus Bathyarchaeota archaeon]
MSLLMIPGPTTPAQRVMLAMSRPLINHRGPEFKLLLEEIQTGLKYVFQTENPIVILTSSGTGGMEFAVSNVINKSDTVIVPTMGFFCDRFAEIVEACGGRVSRIQIEWGSSVKPDMVEEAFARERNVKAILIIHNETSTGVLVRDLAEISRIAHDHDALVIVDAISSLGGVELLTDKWSIDACVTGSQKCIAAPPGLAFVSVSERFIEEAKRVNRGVYFNLKAYLEYMERGQTPYTPSIPLLYALSEALKMIREEGLEARIARHRKCAKAFYRAIEALDLEPYPFEYEYRSKTVIAVKTPKNIDSEELVKTMRLKHSVVVSGGQGKLRGSIFRIGCMGNVSAYEVLATVNALESSLAYLGYGVEKVGVGLAEAGKVLWSS